LVKEAAGGKKTLYVCSGRAGGRARDNSIWQKQKGETRALFRKRTGRGAKGEAKKPTALGECIFQSVSLPRAQRPKLQLKGSGGSGFWTKVARSGE
jgi:hypothetical protein